MSNNTVTITEANRIIKDIAKHGYENPKERIPVMLHGPAGCGKSDVVFSAVEELNKELGITDNPYQVSDVRLSSLNPVDVRGMPYRKDDEVVFSRPYFFPKEGENRVIFLDEINTAPPATQVTAYEMARNYSVGGNPFPLSTLIVLAGNRTKDKGATFSMPKPLENRLLHLHVGYDVKSWVQWGYKNGINEDVLAFIQFRPDLIGSDTPPDSSAFPTPRTWHYVSNIMKIPSVNEDMISGLIGVGAASEFFAFQRLKKELPSIEGIFENGLGDFDISKKDTSIKFAFTAAISSQIKKTGDNPTHLANFTEAFKALPQEFQVIAFWMFREMPAMGKFMAQKGIPQLVTKFVSND